MRSISRRRMGSRVGRRGNERKGSSDGQEYECERKGQKDESISKYRTSTDELEKGSEDLDLCIGGARVVLHVVLAGVAVGGQVVILGRGSWIVGGVYFYIHNHGLT